MLCSSGLSCKLQVAHRSPSSTSPRQTQDSPASASGDSWPTEQSTTHELQHAMALPTLPPAQPLHSDPQGLSQGTGKFLNHSGRPSSPATFRVKPSRLSPLDPPCLLSRARYSALRKLSVWTSRYITHRVIITRSQICLFQESGSPSMPLTKSYPSFEPLVPSTGQIRGVHTIFTEQINAPHSKGLPKTSSDQAL